MQSELLNCRQNKPQSFTKSISNSFFKCVSYEVQYTHLDSGDDFKHMKTMISFGTYLAECTAM